MFSMEVFLYMNVMEVQEKEFQINKDHDSKRQHVIQTNQTRKKIMKQMVVIRWYPALLGKFPRHVQEISSMVQTGGRLYIRSF